MSHTVSEAVGMFISIGLLFVVAWIRSVIWPIVKEEKRWVKRLMIGLKVTILCLAALGFPIPCTPRTIRFLVRD